MTKFVNSDKLYRWKYKAVDSNNVYTFTGLVEADSIDTALEFVENHFRSKYPTFVWGNRGKWDDAVIKYGPTVQKVKVRR